jgi:hypothetical protein
MNNLLLACALLTLLSLSGCAAVPGSPAGAVSPIPLYMQPNHYDAPRGYSMK